MTQQAAGRYIDARHACELLDVRPQTLYAYVSRGLIRSEPASGKSRARRYHREDLDRLVQRKQLRADPSQAALGALRTGEPVLESSLTLITDSAVFYRGLNGLDLARQRSFHEVAALLWTGDLSNVDLLLGPTKQVDDVRELAQLPTLLRMQAMLPVAAAADPMSADLQRSSLYRVGSRIVGLLTGVAGGQRQDEGIGKALQQAWVPDRPEVAALIESTLILCADHELNASAFTARCVASSGANLYAVVGAALGALSGFRHGGATQQVEAMWQELDSARDAHSVVVDRLQRGDRIPGFGHAIYKGADPRATLLLSLIEQQFPSAEAIEKLDDLQKAVADVMDLHCNIDLALAALRRVAGLPAGSAQVLFALGRTAGWIAHAIEQYDTGKLIRPRASYVGPAPDDEKAATPVP